MLYNLLKYLLAHDNYIFNLLKFLVRDKYIFSLQLISPDRIIFNKNFHRKYIPANKKSSRSILIFDEIPSILS